MSGPYPIGVVEEGVGAVSIGMRNGNGTQPRLSLWSAHAP